MAGVLPINQSAEERKMQSNPAFPRLFRYPACEYSNASLTFPGEKS
jgi:hypothetical protein